MQLAEHNTAVIGFGITGQSCVRFLLSQQAQVTVFDTREVLQVKSHVPVVLGNIPETALLSFDLIVVSPGISLNMPAISAARKAGIKVIGDIELFAHFVSCPVIAVTGSNGKTTVVDMLSHIFRDSGKRVGIGGNIGTPALDLLQDTHDLVVLELSSFQLETCENLRPFIAVILNISEDHLDRHGSFSEYRDAKHKIFQNATLKIANGQDEHTLPITDDANYLLGIEQAHGLGFDGAKASLTLDGDVILTGSEMKVAGLHNLFNAQAAIQIALLSEVALHEILATLRQYVGLPHRCQKIRELHGVEWIDDSKATNVGATLAGIEGIKGTVSGNIILLAGGDSKQADLSPLRRCFEQNVKHLIVFGKDAELLAQIKLPLLHADSLEDAVHCAANVAQSGDVVLLSPACASLDMFENFSHRGRCFQEAVGRLR